MTEADSASAGMRLPDVWSSHVDDGVGVGVALGVGDGVGDGVKPGGGSRSASPSSRRPVVNRHFDSELKPPKKLPLKTIWHCSGWPVAQSGSQGLPSKYVGHGSS